MDWPGHHKAGIVPKRESKQAIWLLLIGALLLLLGSCGEAEEPTPDAQVIITSASQRMADLEGFRFTISMTGLPVFLDSDETLALKTAEGFFATPDKAIGTVSIQAPGLVTEVDIISIGSEQWLTNILTGEWMALPPDWGFNPAILFDTTEGFVAILTADLIEPMVTGTEKIDDGPDKKLYRLEGRLDGERLAELTLGLIGPEPSDVTLWVDPETFTIARVTVLNPAGGDEDSASIWQLDFNRFGEIVSIEPPL